MVFNISSLEKGNTGVNTGLKPGVNTTVNPKVNTELNLSFQVINCVMHGQSLSLCKNQT